MGSSSIAWGTGPAGCSEPPIPRGALFRFILSASPAGSGPHRAGSCGASRRILTLSSAPSADFWPGGYLQARLGHSSRDRRGPVRGPREGGETHVPHNVVLAESVTNVQDAQCAVAARPCKSKIHSHLVRSDAYAALPDRARSLLQVLFGAANGAQMRLATSGDELCEFTVRMTLGKIADRLGCTDRTIQRAAKALEAVGWLRRELTGRATRYVLAVPAPVGGQRVENPSHLAAACRPCPDKSVGSDPTKLSSPHTSIHLPVSAAAAPAKQRSERGSFPPLSPSRAPAAAAAALTQQDQEAADRFRKAARASGLTETGEACQTARDLGELAARVLAASERPTQARADEIRNAVEVVAERCRERGVGRGNGRISNPRGLLLSLLRDGCEQSKASRVRGHQTRRRESGGGNSTAARTAVAPAPRPAAAPMPPELRAMARRRVVA